MSEQEKQSSKPESVRIVPAEPKDPKWPTPTQGTKVVTESGVQIRGIHRIELTADVNDVWTAAIHVHVDPVGISSIRSDAVFIPSKPLNWWQKLLIGVLGLTVDVTSLCDVDGRRFAKP